MTTTPPAGLPADAELLELLDERAIRRLMTDYTTFVDFGHAARIAELFTEDGVWEGPGVRMDGAAEVRRFFSAREQVTRRTSRHVITNIAITFEGPDAATALSYLVNFRHDASGDAPARPAPAEAPKYVGEYHDRFVRTADGWRFSVRTFENAFLRTRSTG